MKTEDKIDNACEWIERLASNDYTLQTQQLANSNNRCCLGVLRDVVGGTELDTAALLMGTTCAAAGLRFAVQPTLARANDSKHYPHSHIAKGILEDPYHFFSKAVAKGVEEYFRDNI